MNTNQAYITCIYLAAGMGRRFKSQQSKLLHPYPAHASHSKPLLHYGLNALLTAQQTTPTIKNINIITGHQNQQIKKTIQAEFSPQQQKNLQFIHNPNYQSGFYSSLRTGIETASEKTTHFLILPADLPDIKAEIIARIANYAETQTETPVHMPITPDNQVGNPTLLHKNIIPLLAQYKQQNKNKGENDVGAITLIKHLCQTKPGSVQFIPINDAAIVKDIDTRDDLNA